MHGSWNTNQEVGQNRPTAGGIALPPIISDLEGDAPVLLTNEAFVNVSSDAAHALVATLYAGSRQGIPNVRYAMAYQMADGSCGGDLIDVFHYNNDQVSFSVADIAGKGIRAAVHASMIKYGLRAFTSSGLTPENVMRGLDRLYLENNAFEQTPDSFATVFFGVADSTRRNLQYTNAAHDPVFLVHPDGDVVSLAPTAPLVGVFEDQHHLFTQRIANLQHGSLLIVTTDGVSEARNADRGLFGVDRIIEIATQMRVLPEPEIAHAILTAANQHSGASSRDDIAILVARFLTDTTSIGER